MHINNKIHVDGYYLTSFMMAVDFKGKSSTEMRKIVAQNDRKASEATAAIYEGITSCAKRKQNPRQRNGCHYTQKSQECFHIVESTFKIFNYI